jgi:hypothetical protein
MLLQLWKMSGHVPIPEGVLTKKVFYVHNTSYYDTQVYRVQSRFVLSYSIPQVPRKGDVSRGSGLLTKSWSSIL